MRSRQQRPRLPLDPRPCQHLLFHLHSQRPDKHEVVFPRGFHLRFPDDEGCRTSSCLRLCVLFGEASVPVLPAACSVGINRLPTVGRASPCHASRELVTSQLIHRSQQFRDTNAILQ